MLCPLAPLAAAAFLSAGVAPGAPDVYGGTAPATAQLAAHPFDRVCDANRGALSAVPGVLATLPFTRNGVQDICSHNTLNLSFKVTGPGSGVTCSMVWFEADSPSAKVSALQAVAPDMAFRPNPDGLLTAAITGRPPLTMRAAALTLAALDPVVGLIAEANGGDRSSSAMVAGLQHVLGSIDPEPAYLHAGWTLSNGYEGERVALAGDTSTAFRIFRRAP